MSRKLSNKALVRTSHRRSVKTLKEVKALRKRIALYHVMGYSKSRIAKTLGTSFATVSRYLDDDATQRLVQQFEDDIYSSVERKFRHLLVSAVDRLQNILQAADDDEVALKAVEMIMKMEGRLGGDKGANAIEQMLAAGGGLVGSFALTQGQAEKIMKFLDETRPEETSNATLQPAIPVTATPVREKKK